jgi:hypothetical protein
LMLCSVSLSTDSGLLRDVKKLVLRCSQFIIILAFHFAVVYKSWKSIQISCHYTRVPSRVQVSTTWLLHSIRLCVAQEMNNDCKLLYDTVMTYLIVPRLRSLWAGYTCVPVNWRLVSIWQLLCIWRGCGFWWRLPLHDGASWSIWQA